MDNAFFKSWNSTQLIRFFMHEIMAMRKCSQSFDTIAKYLFQKTNVEIKTSCLKTIFLREVKSYPFDESRLEELKIQVLTMLENLREGFIDKEFKNKKLSPAQISHPLPLAHIFEKKIEIPDASKDIFITERTADDLPIQIQPEIEKQKRVEYIINDAFKNNPLINVGPDDFEEAIKNGYKPFDPISGFDVDNSEKYYKRPFAWFIEAVRYKHYINPSENTTIEMRDGRANKKPIRLELNNIYQQKILKGHFCSWDDVIDYFI